MGAAPPTRPRGMDVVEFIDEVVRDLKVISRADATWRSYSLWQGLYGDWCVVLGVEFPWGDVHEIRMVWERALAVMWLREGYGAKTL